MNSRKCNLYVCTCICIDIDVFAHSPVKVPKSHQLCYWPPRNPQLQKLGLLGFWGPVGLCLGFRKFKSSRIHNFNATRPASARPSASA